MPVHIRAYTPLDKRYEPRRPYIDCVCGGSGFGFLADYIPGFGDVDVFRWDLDSRVMRKTYIRRHQIIKDVLLCYLVTDRRGGSPIDFPHQTCFKNLDEAYVHANWHLDHLMSQYQLTNCQLTITCTLESKICLAAFCPYDSFSIIIQEIEVPV